MYIKDLMINPIISLPVASFIVFVLSSQPLRTKNTHHTSCYCDHSLEFEGVDYFTNLPPPYSHCYQNWQNIAGFKTD